MLLGGGAGALAGLAGLTRSIGVAVVLGVVIALLARRRRAAALAAGSAAVLLLAPWAAWTVAHRAGVDPAITANYGTYGDLVRQAGWSWLGASSLLEFGRPLAALALPVRGGWLVPLAAVPVLLALAAGLRAGLARAPAAGWMLLAYLAIVALWPYAPDRFVWAALPFLACAFTLGIAELWRRDGRWARPARGVSVAALALVVIGFVPRQARGLLRGDATRTQRGISATFEAVLPWVRGATDTAAVVATEDEALLWLYTGRRAVPSYLWRVRGRAAESFGPDTLHAFLMRTGATHLVLTGPGSDAAPTINDLIGARPRFLRLVHLWPGQMMAFAIARGAAAAPAAPGTAAARP
jgi:hypothetical protein